MSAKTAIVLGASRGIGLACAGQLAHAGRRVVLFARNTDVLEKACAQLTKEGVEVHAIAGDLAIAGDMERLFGTVSKRWGGCDILVNNNGGPKPGSLLSLSEQAWRESFETHVLPAMRAIRLAVPWMKHQGWGRIITIGSLSAKQPLDNLDLSNYARAGLAACIKTLSRELAPHKVLVHMVCPGAVLTDRSRTRIEARAADKGISYEESLALSEAAVPMRRLGTPEDIGRVVAFLASDAAAYMTGNIIQVDGGMSWGLP